MWGQPSALPFARPQKRNTPTYVGTTEKAAKQAALFEEHPHVCGDNDLLRLEARIAEGTPPRMWGQRYQVCL